MAGERRAPAPPQVALDGQQTAKRAPAPPQLAPYRYAAAEDDYCWVCGGAVVKRHCKITCTVCGFMRDCSDA